MFGGLLGGRGTYVVTPADPWYVWGGYYETGTLIWRSRWVGTSRTECREALAMPADPHRAVILRRIMAVDGPARVTVTLDVRAGFGRSPMTDLSKTGGCWTGRSGRLRFRWSGAARARPGDDGLSFTVTLPAGGQHDLVLELSDRALDGEPPDPDRTWAATEEAWSEVVPACDDLAAPRDARHAYAVLRGLTSSTGAMVAAATTSLPERLEGGRNYDYRYAWIRDQCYAGLAVAAHGPHPLLDGSVRFVTERLLADGPGLMPAYTVAGEPIPGERALRVPGYPGGTARAGNWVAGQFQLDALGEALRAVRRGRPPGPAGRGELAGGGDRGRGDREALDRARRGHLGAARTGTGRIPASRACPACAPWPPPRTGRRAVPGTGRRPGGARWPTRCWPAWATRSTRPGRWQRSPDDARVDAALLLPVIRGTLPADDPRNRATVRAVTDELTEDGYVYRFRHDARPMHKSEGAFLLCGFWLAQVAQACGDTTAAARWFERNRAACGPAGLYTEEYDVRQRQSRGNLPQAFVHAGMLECAVRLSADPGA